MKTLTFVIPTFNESKRLAKTFAALKTVKLPKSLQLEEVIFVDDGSTDNTVSRIKYFVSSIKGDPKIRNTKYKIQIVSYPYNRGKGFAVKKGILASNADYTLFFDADMSTPLSQIKKFEPFFYQKVDVIIGTRKNGKPTVIVHQPFIRELLGRAFTLLTQIVLQLDTTDFTCGFKAFSRNAKSFIFAKSVVERWGYDAELIFLAKKGGLSTVEKAVLWSNDPDTKVKLYKAIPQTLMDLGIIYSTHVIKPSIMEYKQFGIIYRGAVQIASVFL